LPRAQQATDTLFDRWWSAATPDAAAAVGEEIAASGISFDAALSRLEAGRPYSRRAPTGIVRSSRQENGIEFYYALNVPADYDPARSYPVRFHLHGGVTVPEDNQPRGNGDIGALAGGEPHVYVLPSGWVDAPWWSDRQVRNLREILRAVKRTYNIDENRVSLSGVSDGGTSAWFVAIRDPAPYASFVAMIGSLMVLRERALVRNDLFPNNLSNRPFFVVNGALDPLYPTALVEPVLRHLKERGVKIEYRPQLTGAHNTVWWPEVRPEVDEFLRRSRRTALPDTVTWECSDGAAQARAGWVRIDRVRAAKERQLADLNLMPMPPTREFGVMALGTRVTTVVVGSSAARVGLRRGDIVMSVDGAALPAGEDFDQALTRCRPSNPIAISVLRDGAQVELKGVYEPVKVGDGSLRLFDRRSPSGRVDLTRSGNAVIAATSGVDAFTLLLSPDAFDFSKPISVQANGRTAFEGKLTPSVRTLMKWAAVDDDRTMLFGQELQLTVA
jgi:hypothetical protein